VVFLCHLSTKVAIPLINFVGQGAPKKLSSLLFYCVFHILIGELVPAVLTAASFELDVFGAHRALLFVLVGVELPCA
jgi:hypothetical protein